MESSFLGVELGALVGEGLLGVELISLLGIEVGVLLGVELGSLLGERLLGVELPEREKVRSHFSITTLVLPDSPPAW